MPQQRLRRRVWGPPRSRAEEPSGTRHLERAPTGRETLARPRGVPCRPRVESSPVRKRREGPDRKSPGDSVGSPDPEHAPQQQRKGRRRDEARRVCRPGRGSHGFRRGRTCPSPSSLSSSPFDLCPSTGTPPLAPHDANVYVQPPAGELSLPGCRLQSVAASYRYRQKCLNFTIRLLVCPVF